MIQIIEATGHKNLSLSDYSEDAKFAVAVSQLRAEAQRATAKLAGRTVWMVNSTAAGGGVAEMLPRLRTLMTEMGVLVKWAVIGADQEEFFHLTKKLHNLIHDNAQDGIELGPTEAKVYEAINRRNFEAFKKHLGPDDVVVIHDPQPLPLGRMISEELGLPTIWRCHIGLDKHTAATRAAWRFLEPYCDRYQHAAFSVPEYIPSFFAGRSSILYPGIDPLSHKNRDLSASKMIGILCNSGLQQAHEPVPTPDFEHQVMRLMPDGSVTIPGEVGLLFRPIILQVSRWDRLKGWLPLMEGFIRMRQEHARLKESSLDPRSRRRLELSRLVLAGPDPASIDDDPEGLDVFREICARYRGLEPSLQKDIVILQLPMAVRKENALVVNALQRCAELVVQNSLQEGFGLTATEAMWKHMAIMGTHACGLRQQIRDGIDGVLVQDPLDADEIAARLSKLLIDPIGRYLMGRSGQRRVYDEFLVFRQISRYFDLLTSCV